MRAYVRLTTPHVSRPQDLVYVGDSPSDGKAARAAGCKSVGVAWGSHPVENLAPQFDIIVHTPAGTPPLLRALSKQHGCASIPTTTARCRVIAPAPQNHYHQSPRNPSTTTTTTTAATTAIHRAGCRVALLSHNRVGVRRLNCNCTIPPRVKHGSACRADLTRHRSIGIRARAAHHARARSSGVRIRSAHRHIDIHFEAQKQRTQLAEVQACLINRCPPEESGRSPAPPSASPPRAGMLNNRGGPAVVVGEGVVRMW